MNEFTLNSLVFVLKRKKSFKKSSYFITIAIENPQLAYYAGSKIQAPTKDLLQYIFIVFDVLISKTQIIQDLHLYLMLKN
jgi:hypothetical protein